MEIDIEQDIVSVTDLKRRTKSVIEHVHGTRRPVVITVNGRADVVLMSAKTLRAAMAVHALRLKAKPLWATTRAR